MTEGGRFRPFPPPRAPGWEQVQGVPVERIGGVGLRSEGGVLAMVSQFRDSEAEPWTWHVSVSLMGVIRLPDLPAMAVLSELVPDVIVWEEKQPPGVQNLAVRHFFARAEET